MTAPLALRSERALGVATPAPLPFQAGSGTAVATLTGNVAAIFVLESFDRRHRFAIYSLRIANNSSSPLIGRIWIVSHDGAASPAYPVSVEIAPYTQRSTDVPVWLDDRTSFARAIAEIVGEGVECIVEAAAPAVADRERRLYPAIAAAGLAVAFLVAAGTALGMSLPRIAAFAVPPMAMNGTTVQAEYSASGAGTLAYAVTAPDGHRVAGGPLAAHSGAIPVAIPTSSDNGAYTLALTMRGPLGTAKEVRVLNGVVPKGRGGAQISDIAVTPVVAKAGQTVTVTYAASGTDGFVRLLGTDGTIWAQKPFSRDGKAEFVVPAVIDSREMRVLLHVIKGRSAAESSAGLVVAGAASEKFSATGAAPPAAAGDGDANGTFAVAARTIKSGGTIKVAILSPRNGMRVALTDTRSTEVTGVDVGADEETVTLRAPTVGLATRYTVVATFTDGFGEESIVQPVTVTP
ncbi:MAG: hypothetical protein ABI231_02100 [Candidatus Tumulicola sp.]